ncbi:hypothetical protein EQH57_0318 [Dictyocoela roeselum]|nr:hypothetical protein EQH57_0318 [Dictyocoela roeselum]
MVISEQLKYLDNQCQKIVISPEENISTLKSLLSDITTPLSLPIYLKLFQSILPLYKIKIIEDKVKHCNEYVRLKNYDKDLLDAYREYVKLIVGCDEYESYKAAVELFRAFDHFNLVEKLIVKVLKGTLHPSKQVRRMCHAVLGEKLSKATDISFKVVHQMIELKFDPSAILHITKMNFDSGHTAEIDENQDQASKVKDSRSKKEKEQKKNKEAEIKEYDKIVKRNRDAINRLYLYILRNKEESFYLYTLQGLKNCELRNDLAEGTLLLLNDIMITNDDPEILAYAVNTAASQFAAKDYSLTIALNTLTKIIKPFSNVPIPIILDAVDILCIKNKQCKSIVSFLLKNMMLVSITVYSNELIDMINFMSQKYQIDVEDDFYGYDLFKKIYRVR